MTGQMRCLQAFSIALVFSAAGLGSAQTSAVQPPVGRATFKSGVDLVTVSAVVRDHKGRVVTDLVQADFELLDNGERRPITDFRAERAGVSCCSTPAGACRSRPRSRTPAGLPATCSRG
jgi:hypothetical protein